MGLRKEQEGFRHNRSRVDQINTLRVIIEQSFEFQSPLTSCLWTTRELLIP